MAVVRTYKSGLGRGIAPLLIIGGLSAALMLSGATASVQAEAPQQQVVSLNSDVAVEVVPTTVASVATTSAPLATAPATTPATSAPVKAAQVKAAPVVTAAPAAPVTAPAAPAVTAAPQVATTATPNTVAKPVVTEDVEIGTPCVIIRNGPSTGC